MALPWTKYWAPTDDGVTLKSVDLRNLQDDIDSYITTNPTTGVVTITGTQIITGTKTFADAKVTSRSVFTNGDLSAGVLTITDTAGLTAPYTRNIVIFNNNNKQIIPDDITGTANTALVDLTSYGTITGVWGWAQIK